MLHHCCYTITATPLPLLLHHCYYMLLLLLLLCICWGRESYESRPFYLLTARSQRRYGPRPDTVYNATHRYNVHMRVRTKEWGCMCVCACACSPAAAAASDCANVREYVRVCMCMCAFGRPSMHASQRWQVGSGHGPSQACMVATCVHVSSLGHKQPILPLLPLLLLLLLLCAQVCTIHYNDCKYIELHVARTHPNQRGMRI